MPTVGIELLGEGASFCYVPDASKSATAVLMVRTEIDRNSARPRDPSLCLVGPKGQWNDPWLQKFGRVESAGHVKRGGLRVFSMEGSALFATT